MTYQSLPSRTWENFKDCVRGFLDLFDFNNTKLRPPPEIVGLGPAPEIIIPLHVDVFVVGKGVDYDAIYQVRRAMEVVAKFWAEKLGIAVLAHVSGYQSMNGTFGHRLKHIYTTGANTPSLYVYADLEVVGPGHLGEAFNIDGYANVAGKPDDVDLQSDAGLALIAGHELGHVTGGITTHADGTFISTRINPDHDRVSNKQRAAIRLGAAKLAGKVFLS